MPHEFKLEPQALKRRFSVYVVIASDLETTKLYVGKTGDNREGCNPIISRCGNHFSYNKIHSQIRNKLAAHEDWTYTYVFDHFDEYPRDRRERRRCVARINEMERWLNQLVQAEPKLRDAELLNPFIGRSCIPAKERKKKDGFRTPESEQVLLGIVDSVCNVVGNSR